MPDHDDIEYTRRLQGSDRWWKRTVAQLPYRIHIRKVATGRVLDVGCGTGRNLQNLGPGAVGVDTNPHSVAVARSKGLTAQTVDDFKADDRWKAGDFDVLLFAHVLEHMELREAIRLVGDYLTYLSSEGTVVAIVPQEAGFRSDITHVSTVGSDELAAIADSNSLTLERVYSFPLPRAAGKWFRHNETVALMRRARGGPLSSISWALLGSQINSPSPPGQSRGDPRVHLVARLVSGVCHH